MAKKQHNSRRRKSFGKRISGGINSLTEWIEGFFKSVFAVVGKSFGFLGTLLIPKSLTKRFDKATHSTGKSVGKKVGAITEKVEKQFSKGASGFFASIGYIFKIFVPKPLLDWFSKRSKVISKSTRKFFQRIGKGLGSLAERYLPTWLVNAGKRFSKRFRRGWRTTSKFTTAWWKSRNFHALAWATPAFLLGIPLTVGLLLVSISDGSPRIGHYRRVMLTALAERDFETADLFNRKLTQLGYRESERADFDTAVALAENGDLQGAYDGMLRIAPLPKQNPQMSTAPTVATDDQPKPDTPPIETDESTTDEETEADDAGYIPAHQWISGALLNGEIEWVSQEEALKLAKAHIDVVLVEEPDNKYAKYLMVRYFEKTNNLDTAIKYMIDLVGEYPRFNGELMQYYLATGASIRAKSSAKKYVNFMQTAKEDQLIASDFALWASALNLTGDAEEAAKVARRAGQLYPDDPVIKRIAAIAVLAKLSQTAQDSPEAIMLLREAHELDPSNLKIANRLATRLVFEPIKVEQMLMEMKRKQTVSGDVFLLAGEMHVRGGRTEEGVRLFKEAISVDDQCCQAYNNLAWIQANVAPVNPKQALLTINKALEVEERADFFETRGQVYFQLDEIELAASDLERALNGVLPLNDRFNSHLTLARIYKRLGNKERAAAHASRATVLGNNR